MVSSENIAEDWNVSEKWKHDHIQEKKYFKPRKI
jgi:hypothetical protein